MTGFSWKTKLPRNLSAIEESVSKGNSWPWYHQQAQESIVTRLPDLRCGAAGSRLAMPGATGRLSPIAMSSKRPTSEQTMPVVRKHGRGQPLCRLCAGMKAFSSGMTVIRACLLALFTVSLSAQTVDRLVGKNVSIAQTNYEGRSAIQIIATPGAANATSYAVIKNAVFRDGTIEADLAGQPMRGAGEGARGFIGIAFRLQSDGSYEYIYLRPTNGRADDQVRRNHSTQYSSYPDFDFARSRQEAPEKYESYVDLQPGVWTKYKIEVESRKARLFVNGAEQPCLIVNDLRLEPREGGVALWVEPGTEGYFSNLKITAK